MRRNSAMMFTVHCALFGILLPSITIAQDTNSWHPLLGQQGGEDDAISSTYQHYQPSAPSHSFSSLVAQQYQPQAHHTPGGQCDLYKVVFNQDLYFQHVQYKTDVPELKEFTLCFWNKFLNHSSDHPLFSYAVDGQLKAIVSWVSNSMSSSYYSMSVNGHTLYRLNYPLRLNKWYHTCQSWNGKTGEWQIWVNAERVGRGFNNRLVGHTVKGGGIAITGQEQAQLEGGSQDGYGSPKGSGGMLGEFTMLQLYKVALTAGKAHRDHKHHHAHHYDHNGAEITTTPAPATTNRPTQPSHPLITGGQLNPGAALNIAAMQQPLLVQGQQFQSQYFNGQFAPSFVTQQLSQAAQPDQRPQTFNAPRPAAPTSFGIQVEPQTQTQPQAPAFDFNSQSQSLFVPTAQGQNDLTSYSQQTFTFGGRPLLNSGLINHGEATAPAADDGHSLFKRQNANERSKRQAADKTKRELVLANGQLIDDSVLAGGLDPSLLDGLAGISDNEPVLQQQMKQEEREPAEAEVKAVMSVCSGCDPEPFSKALVISWRSVAKKLYSGALYTSANTECRVF